MEEEIEEALDLSAPSELVDDSVVLLCGCGVVVGVEVGYWEEEGGNCLKKCGIWKEAEGEGEGEGEGAGVELGRLEGGGGAPIAGEGGGSRFVFNTSLGENETPS